MKCFALMFVAIAALAIGCSKQPEPKPPPQYYTMEKFNKIQNGMTMIEVETIIGRWTVASAGGSSPEKYQWKRGEHEIDVDFVNGKVISKSSHNLD